MTIIDTTTVAVLLSLVAFAVLAGLTALTVALVRTVPAQRRIRLARHESLPRYYGYALLGH